MMMMAGGSIMRGMGERKRERFNAATSALNAAITLEDKEIQTAIMRRENARYIASSAATYGARGVEISGSPLDVLAEDARTAEQNVLMMQRDMDLRAMGLRREEYGAQQRGRAAMMSGVFGAGRALLSGD